MTSDTKNARSERTARSRVVAENFALRRGVDAMLLVKASGKASVEEIDDLDHAIAALNTMIEGRVRTLRLIDMVSGDADVTCLCGECDTDRG